MIDVSGYGPRIAQAILEIGARMGERGTLDLIGHLVAAELERPEGDFSTSTVQGWTKERSEPTLAVFKALAKLSGRQASWIAFGDEPTRGDAALMRSHRDPQPPADRVSGIEGPPQKPHGGTDIGPGGKQHRPPKK